MAENENKKYLDKDGLLYVRQKIESKFVQKETGKGLSTNDLTNELKQTYDDTVTTVAGLVAEGGEANVIETVKVNGTALTPDANKAVNVTVPTKVSDLTNDGDGTSGSKFATESYVNTNGGKIDKIKVNGTEQTITNKAVDITVPTNNNQLTNGAGYQTATQVNTIVEGKGYQTSSDVESAITAKGYQTQSEVNSAITSAISGVTQFDYKIVTSLPTSGVKGTIYLIANTGSGTNIYDEYIYINNKWEMFGTTKVDLSGYVKDEDLIAITNAEIDTIFA